MNYEQKYAFATSIIFKEMFRVICKTAHTQLCYCIRMDRHIPDEGEKLGKARGTTLYCKDGKTEALTFLITLGCVASAF